MKRGCFGEYADFMKQLNKLIVKFNHKKQSNLTFKMQNCNEKCVIQFISFLSFNKLSLSKSQRHRKKSHFHYFWLKMYTGAFRIKLHKPHVNTIIAPKDVTLFMF